MHQPRIDVSGGEDVTTDAKLDESIIRHLASEYRLSRIPHGVYPSMFACPGIAQHDPSTGGSCGGAFVMSPVAAAVAES